MNIISVSRRTDIPAFYSAWFIGRVREGYAAYRNPFGGQEHRVSLLPENVHSIVFWSKDYSPLIPHLRTLDSSGYHFCFHFTITGLPPVLEENVPSQRETVEQFNKLADEYGPRRIFWRYDPILLSDLTGLDHHLSAFEGLAGELRGRTERCYISFIQYYSKVKRNTAALTNRRGIKCFDPDPEEKFALVSRLAKIAESNDMELLSCCGDHLVEGKVGKGSCIDGALLKELFPDKPFDFRPNPTRPQCACTDSRDIGAYDMCPHGCVYCYANANKDAAKRKHAEHLPHSETLVGNTAEAAERKEPIR
jgi:hypothetical protein